MVSLYHQKVSKKREGSGLAVPTADDTQIMGATSGLGRERPFLWLFVDSFLSLSLSLFLLFPERSPLTTILHAAHSFADREHQQQIPKEAPAVVWTAKAYPVLLPCYHIMVTKPSHQKSSQHMNG